MKKNLQTTLKKGTNELSEKGLVIGSSLMKKIETETLVKTGSNLLTNGKVMKAIEGASSAGLVSKSILDAARDWLKGDKAEAILSLAAGAVPLIASSGFPLAALGTAGIAIGLGFLLKKEKKAQPALLVKGDVSCNR